jgi:hypothetical protein
VTSHLVFTLPRTCSYSVSRKSQNSFNSSICTVYMWKYWNVLFTVASTSTGKLSALVQRALCKMWAAHPMPRVFIFKSLVVSLANTLFVPFLAAPPKFVLQLSPQKAIILFDSLYLSSYVVNTSAVSPFKL